MVQLALHCSRWHACCISDAWATIASKKACMKQMSEPPCDAALEPQNCQAPCQAFSQRLVAAMIGRISRIWSSLTKFRHMSVKHRCIIAFGLSARSFALLIAQCRASGNIPLRPIANRSACQHVVPCRCASGFSICKSFAVCICSRHDPVFTKLKLASPSTCGFV